MSISKSMAVEGSSIGEGIPVGVPQAVPIGAIDGVGISVSDRFSLSVSFSLGEKMSEESISCAVVVKPLHLTDMILGLRDPGSIPGGGPKRFHDSFNFVFTLLGSAFHARQTLIWPRI